MSKASIATPITREFLRDFYTNNPFEPQLDEALRESKVAMREKGIGVFGDLYLGSEKAFRVQLPPKMDQNFMMNREQIEELEQLIPSIPKKVDNADKCMEKILRQLTGARACIESYQKWQTEQVTVMVNEFLPKDFRGDIVRQQKERKDKIREKEMASLIDRGGSIKERYELIWKHQMEKRKTLASLGESTGIFRYVIVYVGGVSEEMLDFVKKINDDDGPMVEQRIAYGPIIHQLSRFANEMRIFVDSWVANAGDSQDEAIKLSDTMTSELLGILENGIDIYSKEIARFVAFFKSVFEKSPFFISKEQTGEKGEINQDLELISLGAGMKHLLPVEVGGEDFTVAWEFVVEGGDVKFSVEFEDQKGQSMRMVPEQLFKSHSGHFKSTASGTCILNFDNTHTMWYKKTVKVKAASMPPVAGVE